MKYIYIMLNLFVGTFLWSIIEPKESFTCFLEIFPALLGVLILVLTFKKFSFTNFTYLMILLHCIILFIGGHYTYAEVPLFDFIKEIFHQTRNNYDKVGHFAQGFVPALIIRELFIRKMVISNKSFFNFIIVSICLAISAAYEWIEWGVSISTGDKGDAFLGTQGDIWDTQSDMLFATIGACIGLLLFSKIQDRQIEEMCRKS
ncbi:COG3647 Predicted membrane protein [Flavobacteriaceae bacterium]